MQNDSELVSRVLNGDASAFDTLVMRYRAVVYRQALRRVGHSQDAEEVTQISFLKAYQNLSHLRQSTDFGAWLRTITTHESISWMRAKRPDTSDLDLFQETRRDDGPTPEQALMEEEVRRAVRQALASLPEHERRVAQAFYLEGKSYREIQQKYGLARTSIAGYLYRARQRLAERLEGVMGLAWLPGAETWLQAMLNVFGGSGGSATAPVTKAVVTVATVAVVAAGVSHQTSTPLQKPASVKVQEINGTSGQAEKSEGLVAKLMRPVTMALGGREALAAETPSEQSDDDGIDLIEHDEFKLVFRENGEIRRFEMREGKLYVEEDGKSRLATDEETAQFKEVQEDIRRVEAQAKEIEKRAESVKPSEEALARIEARARQMGKRGELSEARAREIEKRAEAIGRAAEKRAEKFEKRAEEMGRRIEARAKEIEKAAEKFARKMEDGKGKMSDEDMAEFTRHMSRFGTDITKELAPVMEEIPGMVGDVMKEIGPMMKELQPLIDDAVKSSLDGFSDKDMKKLMDEVSREISSAMKNVEPLMKDADRIRKEGDKARKKALDLNRKAREKSKASRQRSEAAEEKSDDSKEKSAAAEKAEQKADAEAAQGNDDPDEDVDGVEVEVDED